MSQWLGRVLRIHLDGLYIIAAHCESMIPSCPFNSLYFTLQAQFDLNLRNVQKKRSFRVWLVTNHVLQPFGRCKRSALAFLAAFFETLTPWGSLQWNIQGLSCVYWVYADLSLVCWRGDIGLDSMDHPVVIRWQSGGCLLWFIGCPELMATSSTRPLNKPNSTNKLVKLASWNMHVELIR